MVASVEDRFWSKVNKTETCWLWTAGRSPDGYGKVKSGGRTYRAHRFVLMLSGVDVPPDVLVCHHCDEPLCVKPDHLFLGSVLDNTRDKIRKGRLRVAFGENHGHSKISDAQVIEMRALRKQGWLLRELAEKFGVDPASAGLICSGKSRALSTPLD